MKIDNSKKPNRIGKTYSWCTALRSVCFSHLVFTELPLVRLLNQIVKTRNNSEVTVLITARTIYYT